MNVWGVRFVAFVVSGFGCALAGAAYYMGGMFVSPDSAFDINWVVMMMFATLIGGTGTLTGPIVGVLVWYGLRELLTTAFGLQGGVVPDRHGRGGDCREPVRPGRAVEPDERPFARNL